MAVQNWWLVNLIEGHIKATRYNQNEKLEE